MSFLVLEHVVPWDAGFERRAPALPGILELILYAIVIAVVAGLSLTAGVGPTGVPIAVIAVLASVLLARGLFEVGILYGGADAKALMVAGLLVPVDPSPLLALPGQAASLLAVYPFSINLLMDAALVSVAVPIAIAVRNLAHREFAFPRGFVGYMIDVEELPDRFVWLKDPMFSRGDADEELEAETSEADRAIRMRQRDRLRRQGVNRVWVTPQLPFVVLLLAGAAAAVLAGNLVFDLAASL
jgi:preflagellin peptidase FlaK